MSLKLLHLRIPTEYKTADQVGCPCGTCKSVNAYNWEDPRVARGEVIHPRFTPEFLAEQRDQLGSVAFNAQHGQETAPAGGTKFARENLRFFRYAGLAGDSPRPDGCVKRDTHPPLILEQDAHGSPVLDWLDVTIDAAFGKHPDGSEVGMLVVGGLGIQRFVFHDGTKSMDLTETEKAMVALLKAYPARQVVIELKANGEGIENKFNALMVEHGIAGVKCVGVGSGGGDNPLSRAQLMMPEIEAGNLYLMDGAPWLRKFVNQLCDWPSAPKDDAVDALSQCLALHRAKRTWADSVRAQQARQAERAAAAQAVAATVVGNAGPGPNGRVATSGEARCLRCAHTEDTELARLDTEVRGAPGYVEAEPTCSCARCKRFKDVDLNYRAPGRKRFTFRR
jgi:predicted phage terminase large subunit-like protein